MKIYMVIGDNGEGYELHERWNHGAFLTKEAAEKYLENIDDEYTRIKPRYQELGEKVLRGTLTEEEKEEYDALNVNWCWYPRRYTEYFIEEYEILG